MTAFQVFAGLLWTVALLVMAWAEWPLNKLKWAELAAVACIAAVLVAGAG